MATRPVRHLEDAELAREYREALTRSATAARQAALLAHVLQARGLGTLKGEEPTDVDELRVEAGRRSLSAREGLVPA